MTAPTFAALGSVFVDDTPGASSQATGSYSRTSGRGYLVAILLQNSITANPAAPTGISATGLAGGQGTGSPELIVDVAVRTSGTNRANLSIWWAEATSTTNSAITVSYASGDSITSVTVGVIEVDSFETSVDPWVSTNVKSAGGQSLTGGSNNSYYTMNALANVDNRVASWGYINGNPGTGFTFEANLTRLFFGGSSTAPTHEIIGGYRNSATPDTTPAITEASSWTSGMISNEIPVAGTSTITGTAAVTNANDTSSASGTETITGSAAPMAGADTSSVTATETFTGSGTPTNAADTSSASGTETFTGTATPTNAADTSSASGSETITGTATPSEGADTSNAAGDVINPVDGTAAITAGDDTSSASGSETITGTATPSAANDTSSASGTITLTGTATIVLTDDTSTVVALVVITGTVAVTLNGDTVSAIGATGLVVVSYVIAARWREPAPVQGVEFPVVAFAEPRIEPWAEPALPRYREPRP